jgi:hypothetical protein
MEMGAQAGMPWRGLLFRISLPGSQLPQNLASPAYTWGAEESRGSCSALTEAAHMARNGARDKATGARPVWFLPDSWSYGQRSVR